MKKVTKFVDNNDGSYTYRNRYGFIEIEKITNKTWEVNNIVINPKYRKNGHGEKLVKEAFSFMKNRLATGVKLFAPQEEAFEFWHKMGFKDVNRRLKL